MSNAAILQLYTKTKLSLKYLETTQFYIKAFCLSFQFQNFQECEEVQSEKCQQKDVKVPKQIKEHKKKCLLPDDDALPSEATTTGPDESKPVTAPSSYYNTGYPQIDRMDNNVIR